MNEDYEKNKNRKGEWDLDFDGFSGWEDTTTNRKLELSAERIFGRARDCGGTYGGGVFPSFAAANWAKK